MALIAMAGLPGVGKSTIARGLAERFPGVLINVDDVASALVRAEFERSFATGLAGYLVAEQVARVNLALGSHVIVDAANSAGYARNIWTALAREFGTELLVVEVVCTDLAAHAARLATRRLPAGQPRISFDDVVVAYAEAESWAAEPRWLVNTTEDVDHDQVFADVQAALRGY